MSIKKYLEKLDDQSVKAILVAEEECRRAGHKNVDTEQLLLGLLMEKQGQGGRILEKLGLTHKLVRKRISEIVGSGTEMVGVERPFTEKMNRLLEAAGESAKSRGREKIATVHLLEAYTRVFDGVAADILKEAGINREKLKEAIDESV